MRWASTVAASPLLILVASATISPITTRSTLLRSSSAPSWLVRMRTDLLPRWVDPWGWAWGDNDHGGPGDGGDSGDGGSGAGTCRVTATATSSCSYLIFVNGQAIDTEWIHGDQPTQSSIDVPYGAVTVVFKSFCSVPGAGPVATIAGTVDACGTTYISDGSWRCLDHFPSGNWAETGYDDSDWPAAQVYGWGPDGASYIGGVSGFESFCRKTVVVGGAAPAPAPSPPAPSPPADTTTSTPESPAPSPAPSPPPSTWSTTVTTIGDCSLAGADTTDMGNNLAALLGLHQGSGEVTCILTGHHEVDTATTTLPDGCAVPNPCQLTYSFTGTQSWITPEIVDAMLHGADFPSIFHTHTTTEVQVCSGTPAPSAPSPATPSPAPATPPSSSPPSGTATTTTEAPSTSTPPSSSPSSSSSSPPRWSTTVTFVSDCKLADANTDDISSNLATLLGLPSTTDGSTTDQQKGGITTKLVNSIPADTATASTCAVPDPCELTFEFSGTVSTLAAVDAALQGSSFPTIFPSTTTTSTGGDSTTTIGSGTVTICSESIEDGPTTAPAPSPSPVDNTPTAGSPSPSPADTPADAGADIPTSASPSPSPADTPADSGADTPTSTSPSPSPVDSGADLPSAGSPPSATPAPSPIDTTTTPADTPTAASPTPSSPADTTPAPSPVGGDTPAESGADVPTAGSPSPSPADTTPTPVDSGADTPASTSPSPGPADTPVDSGADTPTAGSPSPSPADTTPTDSTPTSTSPAPSPVDTPADSGADVPTAGSPSPSPADTPSDSGADRPTSNSPSPSPVDSGADVPTAGSPSPSPSPADTTPTDSGADTPTSTSPSPSPADTTTPVDSGADTPTAGSPSPSPSPVDSGADVPTAGSPSPSPADTPADSGADTPTSTSPSPSPADTPADSGADTPTTESPSPSPGSDSSIDNGADTTSPNLVTTSPTAAPTAIPTITPTPAPPTAIPTVPPTTAVVATPAPTAASPPGPPPPLPGLPPIVTGPAWQIRLVITGDLDLLLSNNPADVAERFAALLPNYNYTPGNINVTFYTGGGNSSRSSGVGNAGRTLLPASGEETMMSSKAAGGGCDKNDPFAFGIAGSVPVGREVLQEAVNGDGFAGIFQPPKAFCAVQLLDVKDPSICDKPNLLSCGDVMTHSFETYDGSAVFKVTVPSGIKTLTASTCSEESIGDTTLLMYSGCPDTPDAPPVASNEDDETCDYDSTLSTAEVKVTEGEEIYVVVKNHAIYGGTSTVTITCDAY